MSEAKPPVMIEEDVIDLRAVCRVLGKWRCLIVLGTLLTVATSAVVSFYFLAPVYEAEVLLRVTHAAERLQTVNPEGGLEGVVGTLSRPPLMTMQTHVGQLQSEALMQRVVERLNHNELNARTLLEISSATAVKDSNLINLTVQHGEAETARAVANAVSLEYIQFISDMNQEQMDRSVAFLEQQYAATEAELQPVLDELRALRAQWGGWMPADQQVVVDQLESRIDRSQETLDLLAHKITETRIARSIDLGQTTVLIVSAATTPEKPVRPNKQLNIALALVLGLLVFVGLAFLLEHLDYNIKRPEDVERYLELPVVGIIPVINRKTGKGRSY